MGSIEYVTHKRDDGSYQLLKEHLLGVAKLSEKFAEDIGSPREGYRTGMLHDIGKYSPAAQKRQLDPEHTQPIDHSTAGAQAAARIYGDVPAAFAICGHHGGIPDMGMTEGTIGARINKKLEGSMDASVWKKEIQVDKNTDIPPAVLAKPESLTAAMYTRMLFSCLVDADYLDTEEALRGKQPRGRYSDIPELYRKLRMYVSTWLDNPRDDLCKQRNAILNASFQAGNNTRGIYKLTVPTGGGKTISSLAFALSHATAHDLHRIIYVIPYTSIIEQTADVFSKILGVENVLEHHNQAQLDTEGDACDILRQHQLACENWDSPIVVTTAVQFFESVYSSKPSRCRKLHNIANSVIVFDEVQTLPVTLLKPCVSAISELAGSYGATVLLCTATQPPLDTIFSKFTYRLHLREIAPEPDVLFAFFKRVRFAKEGLLSDKQVSEKMLEERQVLCVVNSRKRARDIFKALPSDGSYHLSTLMTAKDREITLKNIRERLRLGQCCRVVSTSLIEAGVDVDFPCVWRETAGLDSILQAAGRCNREGKNPPESSIVHIFDGEGKVSDALLSRIVPTKQILDTFEDINTIAAIQAYYHKLFWACGDEGLDKPHILESEEKLHFHEVSDTFHLIDDDTKTVYIPDGDNEEEIRLLRIGQFSRSQMRKLGRSAVNIPWYEYQTMVKNGAVEDHDSYGFGILLHADAYDKKCGLNSNSGEGSAVFF